ncbi:MAG: hypothetical protein JO297_11455 [Nitrososphaeraceae archaeon]|nr:hypothetical protein [Nitrososphaeraceae archaeon]
MQLPRIGPFVVRLFNTLDSSGSSSSVEELELLIGELNKCGRVKAFRELKPASRTS